jgi:DNA-binding SARP family transcriptional activator
MEFRLLGPLEVRCDGRPVDLGAPEQRALLAALVLERNRVVARDRLVDLLWEDDPPDTARKALQGYVSQLRKAVGGNRLQTRAPGYLLALDDDELDVARFEQLRAAGRFDEALALWHGPALADLATLRFATAEGARLNELRLACLEERIDHALARGEHAQLVGELEGLVGQHPHRERLRGQLMLALHRSGRQAEALDAYRTARAALVDELGIEPGRELRRLHEAILREEPRLDLPERSEPERTAFVGRMAELAELEGGLDDALGGRGRLFLLVGEPGIGKSRLAEEVLARGRARGARVLVGRCWEAGGAPSYWPWVQAMRADDVPAFPEVAGDAAGADPDAARFRLFDETAELLGRASQARPLVILLDDVHAADEPSLLLLRFLARTIAATRILLLVAYRDVDPIPEAPLTETVAEVAREPVTRRLYLHGLSTEEVGEYVDLTAAGLGSADVVRTLHDETEGNPLFVGEMVRLLSAELFRSGSDAGARLAIPPGVRDVIVRRLGHLSPECNSVLGLAAAMGREFALEPLGRVSAVPDDELLDRLDEAIAARVVTGVPGVPGRLRFAHVLIRDTLYDGLTAVRRVRLHRAILDALEDRYGDEPGPHLTELAHHAIAGNDPLRGIGYARRAGDRALATLAFEEAARLYRTALAALDAMDPWDDRMQCRLLLALGDAENCAGNTPAAKRAFIAAADVARRFEFAPELARAALGYGGRMGWGRAGRDDLLVPLLEEAVAALSDDELELRARLLARLAGALRDDPSRDRRNRLSAEAVELARLSGRDAALAYALDGRAVAVCAPDAIEEGLALGTELCEVAARTGDAERVMAGYDTRVVALLQRGQVRAAAADVAAALRLAREVRQPARLWEAHAHESLLALTTGRLDEAEALIPSALALGERAVPDGAIPVHRAQWHTLCDLRGGLDELEPAIRELIADYPARPLFRCLLAHVHARLGRVEEANSALDDLADDDFSAVPFDQEWLYAVSLLAEAAALVGNLERAAVLYRLVLPWATLSAADPGEGMRGSMARYLGLLAATLSRPDDAERHFEAAIVANEEMGARPWLALTQRDYARMLRARDRPGDRERAEELGAAANATFRELGMEAG